MTAGSARKGPKRQGTGLDAGSAGSVVGRLRRALTPDFVLKEEFAKLRAADLRWFAYLVGLAVGQSASMCGPLNRIRAILFVSLFAAALITAGFLVGGRPRGRDFWSWCIFWAAVGMQTPLFRLEVSRSLFGFTTASALAAGAVIGLLGFLAGRITTRLAFFGLCVYAFCTIADALYTGYVLGAFWPPIDAWLNAMVLLLVLTCTAHSVRIWRGPRGNGRGARHGELRDRGAGPSTG